MLSLLLKIFGSKNSDNEQRAKGFSELRHGRSSPAGHILDKIKSLDNEFFLNSINLPEPEAQSFL